MKVFISWSGEHAQALAEALNEWLPTVIQAVQHWISTGIEKGAPQKGARHAIPLLFVLITPLGAATRPPSSGAGPAV